MKRLSLILSFVLTGMAGYLANAAAPRPNILLILADDLGFSDAGCYGGEIRTPNLDQLATHGLRFSQFYNTARCCPTRASLLTGLYPHQAGIGSMTGDAGPRFPGYRGHLLDQCVTIAQVLKSAGYRTYGSGKWHVGDRIDPTTRGFDEFYGFVRGYAVDSWDERMMIRLPAGRPMRHYEAGKFFATDAITDHALDFLTLSRQGERRPWFLYLAYQAPHFPLASRPEDAKGYAQIYEQGWDKIREQRTARLKQLELVAADTQLTPRSAIPKPEVAARLGSQTADGNNPLWDSLDADRRADLARRMATYAGMVTGMDRNIGRVIGDLRQQGELDHTLVLFLSDNGACAEWEPFGFDLLPPATAPTPGTGINMGTPNAPNILHRGADLDRVGGPGTLISYGSGWANACNTPWRLYKHYNHEGGISSPCIVHWPDGLKVKPGSITRQPSHVIDIITTCADVAGAQYPAELNGHPILRAEGRSLVPVFDGKTIQRDFLAWEHEGNRAFRVGQWKLVSVHGNPWELYDLDTDRTELNNLAAKYPERVQSMAGRWEVWARRTQVFPAPGGPKSGKKGAGKK